MRYTTSAIFLIWNKKKSHWSFLCAICVYILHNMGDATDVFVLRSFWHYRRCHTTNRAVSRTAYFLVHYAPKKWFLSSLWFPSANILAPLERISKETFSNNVFVTMLINQEIYIGYGIMDKLLILQHEIIKILNPSYVEV